MAHWHNEDSSRLEAHRHKEIAAELKLQLGKLKQNIVGKRDHVAATISSFKNQFKKLQLGKLKQNIVGKRDHVAATISSFKNQFKKLQLGKLKQNIVGKRDHVAATISSFKNQLQKRTKIYKGFTIHLTCRIYHFTKQLKELDDYVTELRKIENPLGVVLQNIVLIQVEVAYSTFKFCRVYWGWYLVFCHARPQLRCLRLETGI